MDKPERTFEDLLTEYGNANFDSGAWQEGEPLPGEDAVETYTAVLERSQSAKAAVLRELSEIRAKLTKADEVVAEEIDARRKLAAFVSKHTEQLQSQLKEREREIERMVQDEEKYRDWVYDQLDADGQALKESAEREARLRAALQRMPRMALEAGSISWASVFEKVVEEALLTASPTPQEKI